METQCEHTATDNHCEQNNDMDVICLPVKVAPTIASSSINMSDLSKDEQIEIDIDNFRYVICYNSASESVDINATHITEYWLWTAHVTNITKSINKSRVGIDLAPKIVFRMLKDFRDHKLKNNITIEFPHDSINPDDILSIKITCKLLPYDDEYENTKIISLHSVKVSNDTRMEKKFQALKTYMDEKIESLVERIEDLEAQLQNK